MNPITVHPVPIVDGRTPRVTSGFGPRSGGMYDTHYGVDILLPWAGEPKKLPWTSDSGRWAVPDDQLGKPVPAMAAGDGVVVTSRWSGTGDHVKIDHGGGWQTGYMHLRDRRVQVGQRVSAGQPLARIAYSPWLRGGPAAQPPPAKPPKVGLNHLHWEVYKDGKAIDPEEIFGSQLQSLRFVQNPWDGSIAGFMVKVALAGGVGYLLYRYVFT